MSTKLLSCFVGLLLSLGLHRAGPFWAGKHWANYSPYAPAGLYESPPRGCTIEQVNLVSGDSLHLRLLP